MKFNRITFARIGNNETVRYAVEELYSYLKKIDNTLFIDVRFYSDYDPSVRNVIWVGQSYAFADKLLEVPDEALDDAICIDIENNEGIITGCNPRAVLIAAYRFLKELGVAWVRPADDGEIVPEYEITKIDVFVQEKPSYRHRGFFIEGAVSYEHVLEMLKWIPRAGMNSYLMQFFRPYIFFERWYDHKCCDGFFEDEKVSREDVDAIVLELEREIAKRGLIYRKVGHGWTSEPLGYVSEGWYKIQSQEIPDDIKPMLAMMNGERKFFRDIPLNTNLCYSKPEVRKLIVEYIAEYIRNNRYVDVIQFWLGDGSNNYCECDECKDRPSDYYVMMLNDLDEILTRENISTKIAFLLYGNTNWAPLKARFKKTDRFILETAPIARNMSKTFKELDPSVRYTHGEYNKNQTENVQPRDTTEFYAHLQDWQEIYDGESTLCDYHLMWDHFYDPGYYDIARVIYEDMQSLEKIGLNGNLSCQLSRSCFPTNFPLQIMSDTLWDKDCDFTEKALDYYLAAFGPDGEAVMEYMKALSEGFDPYYNRQCFKTKVAPYGSEERIARLKGAIATLTGFEATIKKNLEAGHCSSVRASWEYLSVHTEYCRMLVKPLIAFAQGKNDEREVLAKEFDEFIKLLPARIHKTFDEFWALYCTDRITKVDAKVNEDIEGAAF